jgi:hypothetical protein
MLLAALPVQENSSMPHRPARLSLVPSCQVPRQLMSQLAYCSCKGQSVSHRLRYHGKLLHNSPYCSCNGQSMRRPASSCRSGRSQSANSVAHFQDISEKMPFALVAFRWGIKHQVRTQDPYQLQTNPSLACTFSDGCTAHALLAVRPSTYVTATKMNPAAADGANGAATAAGMWCA